MKKVYNLLAAVTFLVAGVSSASAGRFWTHDQLKQANATTIATGKTYALQAGHSFSAGSSSFLSGTNFSHTTYLSVDNVYTFEAVEGVTGPNGEAVYNLKRQNGEYLAEITNGSFYTKQKDRAWKLVVKDAVGIDGAKTYSYTPEPTDATPDPQPVNLTGIDAWIKEAKDQDNADLQWKLNEIAYNPTNSTLASGAVVISEYVSKSKDKEDKYAQYNFLLHYPTDNEATGYADKGTNYNRNTWCIFEATQSDARKSLDNVVDGLTKGAGDLMDDVLRDFTPGNNSGEYSADKHAALKALWEQYKSLRDGGATLTDDQMDDLADKLPKAYEEFVTSGIPLKAGYYIVYSFRANEESWGTDKPKVYPYGGQQSGYDDGALYDGNALNANDMQLRWSAKTNQQPNFSFEELDSKGYTYEYAKYIWKVVDAGQKDEDGNDLFFFQNAETGNYIGKNGSASSRILMTKEPEVAYTIVASKEFPGNFNFYSPLLVKYTEEGAPSPAKFSGIHTQQGSTDVVAWDYRVAGSCWKVRALQENQVKDIVAAVAQPKRNKALAAEMNKAQAALDKGYSYMGVDATGKKIESSTNGTYSIENGVDGLVTDKEQLDCPMFDSQEGTDIGRLLDGKLSDNEESYFHSTWHGGGEAWPGRGIHYLQVKPGVEMDALLMKWIKRLGNNRGAPKKVAIYGSNSDDALLVNKKDVENDEDGSVTTVYDYWKKDQGWDSLGVTTFEYPYSVVKTDGTEQANQAGTAYFKSAQKYKYFRIVVISRVLDDNWPSNNGFYHGSEFRLYHGAYDEQASLIASVPKNLVDNLKNEIAKSKEMVDKGTATDEQIEAIKKAYEEFMKQFPDPTKVTTALASAKAFAEAAEEGDGLGFYESGAQEAYKSVIEAVQNELNEIQKKGQPTVAQVTDLLSKLSAGTDAFNSKLHMPKNGILRIQSMSSTPSNTNRFAYAPSSSRKNFLRNGGLKKDEGADTYSPDSNFDGQLNSFWSAEKTEKGYTFKNIYTGLYLAPVKNTRTMSQSDEPYYFEVISAKYPGAFNIKIAKDDASGDHVFLNAQPGGNFDLVLWNSANKNDNSAFTFVEGAPTDIAAGYLHELESKTAPQIITLPIEVKTFGDDKAKFFTVAGQNSSTMEIELAQAPEVLKAGVAYIYIPGEANEETTVRLYPTATTVEELKPLTQPVVSDAKPMQGLVGVFENTQVGKDYGVFSTDRTKVLLGEGNDNVAANTGYFGVLPAVTAKGIKSLPTNGVITSIAGAIISNTGAKAAGIYTISGQRLSSTKNLPAGVYVINGKKAVVK